MFSLFLSLVRVSTTKYLDETNPLLPEDQMTEKGKTREKNIPVEAIRESIIFLSRYPLVGSRRILIINDAHRLSHGAQNALLKTLEEPNATAILILITHDAAALLETVHSRLQRISFSLVPEEEIRTLGALDQENQFLFAFGRPGLIQMALEDTREFSSMKVFLERLAQLRHLSLSERLHLAEDLAKESDLVIRLLEWLVALVRNEALSDTANLQPNYFFLEALKNTQHILLSTQANTRLQLEKLFLSAL